MRYRHNGNQGLLLFLLIVVICGIIFGFKYKNEIKIFIETNFDFNETEDFISLEKAERFFYENKSSFEAFTVKETQNTLYINNIYISIINRYDFGGNRIKAFRFQTKSDIGTEIIYSENELQESSILKNIEKHWYVYNYVQD